MSQPQKQPEKPETREEHAVRLKEMVKEVKEKVDEGQTANWGLFLGPQNPVSAAQARDIIEELEGIDQDSGGSSGRSSIEGGREALERSAGTDSRA